MKVGIPNSRGNSRVSGSVCPTQRATPKPGDAYAQHKGSHRTVGGIPHFERPQIRVRIPNSRGYTKVCKSLFPTSAWWGGQQSVKVRIPNWRGQAKPWEHASEKLRGYTKAWELVSLAQGAHQSVGVGMRDGWRHTKAGESVTPPERATPKGVSWYPRFEG